MPKFYIVLSWLGGDDYRRDYCMEIFGADYILFSKKITREKYLAEGGDPT